MEKLYSTSRKYIETEIETHGNQFILLLGVWLLVNDLVLGFYWLGLGIYASIYDIINSTIYTETFSSMRLHFIGTVTICLILDSQNVFNRCTILYSYLKPNTDTMVHQTQQSTPMTPITATTTEKPRYFYAVSCVLILISALGTDMNMIVGLIKTRAVVGPWICEIIAASWGLFNTIIEIMWVLWFCFDQYNVSTTHLHTPIKGN